MVWMRESGDSCMRRRLEHGDEWEEVRVTVASARFYMGGRHYEVTDGTSGGTVIHVISRCIEPFNNME